MDGKEVIPGSGNERFGMRASDADRHAAVRQLSAALDEGRLNLAEYDDRIMAAYQASTYGELEALFADLPQGTVAVPPAAPLAATAVLPAAGHERRGVLADVPGWVRILWTIWFTIVLINLAIWVLVSISSDADKAFWPMWVAGPSGAVLIGLSALGISITRSRREAARRKALARAQRGPKVKTKKNKPAK